MNYNMIASVSQKIFKNIVNIVVKLGINMKEYLLPK